MAQSPHGVTRFGGPFLSAGCHTVSVSYNGDRGRHCSNLVQKDERMGMVERVWRALHDCWSC